MPKDLLELDTFEVGLITNPSEQDVPEEAATFSKNIDSFNSDGALAGVADDVKLTGFPTGSFTGSSTQAVPTTINCQVAKTINDDGVERVIMYENTSGNRSIRKIDAFNSSSPTNMNTLVMGAGGFNSSNEDICMEVNNKEVHMGTGDALSDGPKWVGMISEGQFGESAPSGIQGVNAELTAASAFTTMDKIVADTSGTFLFGADLNNTGNPKIYKFANVGSSVVLVSDADNEFTEICGLCIWKSGQNDQYLLVLDQPNPNEYTLNMVSQLSLEITKTWQCSGMAFADIKQILHVHNSTASKSRIYALRHTLVTSGVGNQSRYSSRLYFVESPVVTDTDTQAFAEMTFKTDFSDVGTHTDVNFYRAPGTFQYFNNSGGHAHWDGDSVLFGNHHRNGSHGGGGYNILFEPHGNSTTEPKVGMCAQFILNPISSDNHGDDVDSPTYYCYSNAAAATEDTHGLAPYGLGDEGRIGLVVHDTAHAEGFSAPMIVYVNYDLTNGETLEPSAASTTIANETDGCIIPIALAWHDDLSSQGSSGTWGYNGSDAYHNIFSCQGHVNTSVTSRLILTRLSTVGSDAKSIIETVDIPTIQTLNSKPVWNPSTYRHEFIENENTSAEIDLGGPVAVPDKIGANHGWQAFASTSTARWASGYGTDAANYVAEAQTALGISTTMYNSGGSLPNNTKFFYKCSYVYDGYQESPLTPYILATETTHTAGSNDRIKLVISLILPSSLKRVTHLNIYAGASIGVSDTEPQGFYRLVRSIPLDQSWGGNSTNTSPDFGAVYDKVIFHRTHEGSSYEARTTIGSHVNTTMVNYGLSTQLNNIHVVANASNEYLDGSNYMFKSKPYNFDQFDWTTDLLRLPQKPTALAAFNGRVYAFTENRIFKIELNSFFIEDTYDGIGCLGPEAVCVTEFGMYWCDKNNMYMNDGSQVLPIGNAVRENTDGNTSYRWQINKAGAKTRVYYNAKKGVVLFEYQTATTGPTYFYAWNVAKSRWDFYEFKSAMNQSSSDEIDGMFLSQAGDTVVVVNDGLYKFLDSDELTRTWAWISKNHSMGTPTQNKKFKKLRVRGSPVGTINQTSNHTGSGIGLDINGANASASGDVDEMKLSSKFKLVQLRMVGQTGVVDSVGYVFKRKPVH